MAARTMASCSAAVGRAVGAPARRVGPYDVHGQLDGLDELDLGVPAQQRVQPAVEQPCRVEVALDGRAVQLDARGGQRVRVAGHPALGARDGQLQQDVVGSDQQVEFGGEFGDPVAQWDIAGELLDAVDVPLRVQLREQFDPGHGVDGVVVRDDRDAHLGDRLVVGEDGTLVGAVGVRRQQHHGPERRRGPARPSGGPRRARPATPGITREPPIADTAVSTTFARSSGVSTWYSPSEPLARPVTAVLDEPGAVPRIAVVVDGEVVVQRQAAVATRTPRQGRFSVAVMQRFPPWCVTFH